MEVFGNVINFEVFCMFELSCSKLLLNGYIVLDYDEEIMIEKLQEVILER